MPATSKLLGVAKRQGFRKGVMGKSRGWTAVWAVVALVNFVRKKRREPEVVERFTLKPGQTIVIKDLGISEVDEEQALRQQQQQQGRRSKGRRRRR